MNEHSPSQIAAELLVTGTYRHKGMTDSIETDDRPI